MLTLAAILLPFTAHLSAEHGIMLFSVIYCTGVYGGAITAILFNIPGAPENAPTAFDGYPMTQKGQAGKAVGAAVMCSALGRNRLSRAHDAGHSTNCRLGHISIRTSGNLCPGVLWLGRCCFGWRKDHLERLALDPRRFDGCRGWVGPGGRH